MFGIQLWIWLAALASVVVVLFSVFQVGHRTGLFRALSALGVLALVWGVAPLLGGHGISPYLEVGAIIAFGFLVLADSLRADSGW